MRISENYFLSLVHSLTPSQSFVARAHVVHARARDPWRRELLAYQVGRAGVGDQYQTAMASRTARRLVGHRLRQVTAHRHVQTRLRDVRVNARRPSTVVPEEVRSFSDYRFVVVRVLNTAQYSLQTKMAIQLSQSRTKVISSLTLPMSTRACVD